MNTSIYHKTFAFTSALLCLVLLSSCSGHIIVWNAKDIIGLILLGLGIIIIGTLFLVAWVRDMINDWKRKRINKK